MTQATINGHTYSDDGASARDMLHGGHRTWFLPMVGDVVTVSGVVAGHAAQTAIDAASAADAAGSTRATSTTSLTVSAGAKTIATQAGKQFTAGNYVTISRTSAPSTMMHGVVTSYSGTALAVEVAISAGSGTYTDWTIALSGPQGATGAIGTAGNIGYVAKTGAYTLTAADKAKVIDCSGTFTISFQACATLGSSWATYVRNSGVGTVTLDPNSAETINGAATYTLHPGSLALILCNGSALVCLPFGTAAMHVRDQKAAGSSGGASVVGVQTRTLNTVASNTIPSASLNASNQVSLPAGRYRFRGWTRTDTGLSSQPILYNVTASAIIALGPEAYNSSIIPFYGEVVLLATSLLEVRSWVDTLSPVGLGAAINSGQSSVFTELIIEQMR